MLISIYHKTIKITVNSYFSHKNIIAATSDFQQCVILISVDSDEPQKPPFKLAPNGVQSVA